jgi:hypothetical protein
VSSGHRYYFDFFLRLGGRNGRIMRLVTLKLLHRHHTTIGTAECTFTTGGVYQNANRNGQIGESNVVRDDGKGAQPAYGFLGIPPLDIIRAIPGYIWGVSVHTVGVNRSQNEGRGKYSSAALT